MTGNNCPAYKHSLVLSLNEVSYYPYLEPEELSFDDRYGDILDGGGVLDKRSKSSIDGLCLLIIHTYIQRSRNPGFDPEKHKVPTKYRQALKTLWDSKRQKIREWQRTIFGDNPYYSADPYLMRKGGPNSNRFNLWITESVEVSVISGKDGQPINSEKLHKLAQYLEKNAGNEPNRLTVELRTDSNAITSAVCQGSLTRVSKFSLHIRWNYKASVCVFWVDSENSIHEFYPALTVNGMDEGNISLKDSELTVPGVGKMEIGTKPGLESCIVLTDKEAFSREIIDKLRSCLEKSVTDGKRDAAVTKPEFKHFPLPKPSPLRRRIRAVAQPGDWEQLVISKSMGLADEVYFFHIPNY